MLIINGADDVNFAKVRDAWAQAKRVIVLTGAGISTSCNIPDFRSPDGLNKQSVREALNYLDGALETRYNADEEVVFEPLRAQVVDGVPDEVLSRPCTDLFRYAAFSDAGQKAAHYRFFALLQESLNQNIVDNSAFHTWIGDLKRNGRLAHWLTQNVDGLEALSGCTIYESDDGRFVDSKHKLDPTTFDVLQMHGGLYHTWCTKSNHLQGITADIAKRFRNGEAAICQKCVSTARPHRFREAAGPGELRPGVVLYDDAHTNAHAIGRVIEDVVAWDIKNGANLLLVAGTSLKVDGAVSLVKDIGKAMRARRGQKQRVSVVMVGRALPGGNLGSVIDYFVKIDCDTFAEAMWHVQGKNAAPKPIKPGQRLFDEKEGDIQGALLA